MVPNKYKLWLKGGTQKEHMPIINLHVSLYHKKNRTFSSTYMKRGTQTNSQCCNPNTPVIGFKGLLCRPVVLN